MKIPINHAKPPKALALALSDDHSHAAISIRGTIGDWWEGRDVNQVENELDWIPATVKNLTVRITSPGGLLSHGLAIHNGLMRHPAHKVAVIEGVAASAATLIAMACNEIHIHANAAMMIHGVRFVDDDGNPVEDPEAERALNETIIETYAAKTGKTREALAKLITQDTWMTGREAFAAGFADKLLELAPVEAQAQALHAFACAAGVPESVIARAQAEAGQGADPAPAPVADDPADPPVAEPPADPGGGPTPEAEATFAAQVNALAAAHGLADHVAAWLLDGAITTAAEASAAIREAREVRDLCTYANAADKAAGYIRARKTLAQVRTELINAAAADADNRPTDSTRRTAATQAHASGAEVWARIFPPRQ